MTGAPPRLSCERFWWTAAGLTCGWKRSPLGVTAATLAAYDVLVLDYEGPRWGEVTEKAVENFVKQGKGLVAVHAANYAFTGLEVLADNHKPSGLKQPPWPEYLQMIGGWWTAGPPKTAHAPRHCFTVKFVDREHPVTRVCRSPSAFPMSSTTVPRCRPTRTSWPRLSMIRRMAARARMSP